MASHDRAFMDKVVDRLIVLEGEGEVQLYSGQYSEYLEDVEERESQAEGINREIEREKLEKREIVTTEDKKKRRLTYQEKKEYQVIFFQGNLCFLETELSFFFFFFKFGFRIWKER